MISILYSVPIIALTATATPEVYSLLYYSLFLRVDDVQTTLRMRNPMIYQSVDDSQEHFYI